MFSLPVSLVGCTDSVLTDVKCMMINLRAQIAGEFPDIRSAITGLPKEPGVIVVHVPSAAAAGQLRLLRDACPNKPILALVDSNTEPAAVFAAMRNGAAQVVPLPIQGPDFEDAIKAIARDHAPDPTHAIGQVIAVAGASGGCGATTLAINLADQFVELSPRRVLLSEPTVSMGRLAVLLDASPTYTAQDLYRGIMSLDPGMVQQSLHTVRDRFFLLASEYRSIPPAPPSPDDVVTLLENMRPLADLLVLDLNCTYDDFFFNLLSSADQVVLVGEQKIPSVRTLQLIIDAMHRLEATGRLHVVINRYDPRIAGFSAEKLRDLLGLPTIHSVASDYRAVTASVNSGRPLRVESPRSPALADISALARHILELEPAPVSAESKPPLLDRLVRAFGLVR